ncbi:heme NO-binding domain-containing protein [Aestuariibacter halophilus]|uniref:Heme NO-binding domain-containing protein n=2 Tax=Fluctibacter halophilus TaxID=226011 RepID=A0ABS8GBT0_9ALTE|nr:heme NO-binding domain-containing protein [Aestuariibacter halophilus]
MSSFAELLEDNFGKTLVTEVMSQCAPVGGMYKPDGYYPFEDFKRLLTVTSRRTGVSEARLQLHFGRYLFSRFATRHAKMLTPYQRVIPMLASLDSEVHKQVRDQYPEAELPHIGVLETQGNHIRLSYRSNHRLISVACGMIEGAGMHFKSPVEVQISEPSATGEYEISVTEQMKSD